jgi:hypothetical protein
VNSNCHTDFKIYFEVTRKGLSRTFEKPFVGGGAVAIAEQTLGFVVPFRNQLKRRLGFK